MKTCTQCKTEKPIEEFRLGGVASNGKRYRASDCNECHRAASRAYRDANLEARRAAEREYGRANAPRKREVASKHYYADPELGRDRAKMGRARKLGAPVVELVRRRRVFERDGGICHVCGDQVEWGDYDMDHVVPLGKAGGSHTYDNVKVSHTKCNLARRNMKRDLP